MSIRLRLTLLFSIILALTLAGFSFLLYFNVSSATQDSIEEALIDDGQQLVNAREFQRDSIVLPASRFAGPETYVQTLTINGTLTDKTANLGEITLPLSNEGLAALQDGQTWLETREVANERVLIYSLPIRAGDQIAGIAQVARSLAEQDRAVATLRTRLIIAGSGVLVLAFVGGWILAGVTLRPIKRLTQMAATIGAERDFDRRVNYNGPKDELGRLATTINGMLAELQVSYQQVEQALQAQRRFVADASHELRTPLTTIRGNLALLSREPPISYEDRVAVLTDIISECERLSRLVNQLLVLARADAGQALRSEQLPVGQMVEEVCRQARLLSPTKAIECSGVDGLQAIGNPDALKQVLLILLDNAVKYTPATSKINVNYLSTNGQIRIVVADNGPGIEPSALPHIFDRFYRTDNARAGDGTGLGLAIAKALIDGQHGTISAASEPGNGTVFTIELPQAPASQSVAAQFSLP